MNKDIVEVKPKICTPIKPKKGTRENLRSSTKNMATDASTVVETNLKEGDPSAESGKVDTNN